MATATEPIQESENFREFRELVDNVLMSRSDLIKRYLDPRRNIDDECGYPKTYSLNAEDYRRLYDRESVAARVVEVLPDEAWMVPPSVFETEDVDQVTSFEEAWENLSKDIIGDDWYMGEEGNPIWEYLHRINRLSGIGSFGVVLLGLDDGKRLSEPVDGIDQNGRAVKNRSPKRLLYLRVFDESLVQITKYESDPTNPRYGQPTEYLITLNDPKERSQGGTGLPLSSQHVHWTRVIHVADGLGSSEIFGVPRMRPVWNRLYDLRKLYGGSAEMYWRGAFPGLSLETHPQLGADVKINKSDIRGMMENYMNGLQRYLSLMGMSAKSLAPQVVDPTPQINIQIDAICIKLGIPKRIFIGSERGDLASSQDDQTWNDRLRAYQNKYLTPRLIRPFVNRLIAIGVLPEPGEGFRIVWPDLNALTEEERASIAVKRTEALMKFVQGGVEALITPVDFLTRVIGMTEEEATTVIENRVSSLESLTQDDEEDDDDFNDDDNEEGEE